MGLGAYRSIQPAIIPLSVSRVILQWKRDDNVKKLISYFDVLLLLAHHLGVGGILWQSKCDHVIQVLVPSQRQTTFGIFSEIAVYVGLHVNVALSKMYLCLANCDLLIS